MYLNRVHNMHGKTINKNHGNRKVDAHKQKMQNRQIQVPQKSCNCEMFPESMKIKTKASKMYTRWITKYFPKSMKINTKPSNM